jgi:hypothetical protein
MKMLLSLKKPPSRVPLLLCPSRKRLAFVVRREFPKSRFVVKSYFVLQICAFEGEDVVIKLIKPDADEIKIRKCLLKESRGDF